MSRGGNMSEEKKVVTEENNRADIEEWFAAAPKQTFETLPAFIKHVMDDYYHDYGTVCHAISACAVATAWACDNMEGAYGGITGFQAGFVMWGFVRHWSKTSNKCGLKLVDYDDFLYPQYEYKHDKTISADVWERIQEQAKQNLVERNYADNRVIEHWESIVDGKVPFGYRVEER